jgi:hypothetical protein
MPPLGTAFALNTSMKNLKLFILSLMTISALSACGNVPATDKKAENLDVSTIPKTTAPGATGTANVFGITNANNTAANQYFATRSGANAITLASLDSTSKPVCVYPVQINNFQPILYASGNVLIKACAQATPAGGYFTLQVPSFNGFYLVPQAQAAGFEGCFQQRNIGNCSAAIISFGEI